MLARERTDDAGKAAATRVDFEIANSEFRCARYGRADFRGASFNYGCGFGTLLADDRGYSRLKNARLLPRYSFDGRAEIRLVIEIDRRDYRHGRLHQVGGVQASTQANLYNP